MSGGVDSVVLLDALVNQRRIGRTDPWDGCEKRPLIVAHFDHGMRNESAQDEAFVRDLAKQYKCEYRSKRVELGANTSEDKARRYRYDFLREVCGEFDAFLVTAHHSNDSAETIAINLTRGTGWRGLAVMDTASIWRPLLAATKQEILAYADKYTIAWREDNTNATPVYLRNRLRSKLQDNDLVLQLAALRSRQLEIKNAIAREVELLTPKAPYSRYFLSHCGDQVAIELLRAIFIRESGESPTIPVRHRVLHFIKTARQGAVIHVAAGVQLRFTRTHFIVEQTDKVLS